MTEQDYADVRDLGRVIAASGIINDILPTSQPLIPENEHRTVSRLLLTWQEALFRKIEARIQGTGQ